MKKEYNSIGKNTNFMCSHMDSLTGVKRPITWLLPDKSYKKCARVPAGRTKKIPRTVYRFKLFMKIPHTDSIWSKAEVMCFWGTVNLSIVFYFSFLTLPCVAAIL